MDQSQIMQLVLNAIGVALGVAALVRPMIGKVIGQIEKLGKEIQDIRLEMVQNYVTQEAVSQGERSNSASHATIHARIDSITERVIQVEANQRACPQCPPIRSKS